MSTVAYLFAASRFPSQREIEKARTHGEYHSEFTTQVSSQRVRFHKNKCKKSRNWIKTPTGPQAILCWGPLGAKQKTEFLSRHAEVRYKNSIL